MAVAVAAEEKGELPTRATGSAWSFGRFGRILAFVSWNSAWFLFCQRLQAVNITINRYSPLLTIIMKPYKRHDTPMASIGF